ncbi:hypothetical protein VTK56DRAFT_3039 [Thermocarpiscus australiensis]
MPTPKPAPAAMRDTMLQFRATKANGRSGDIFATRARRAHPEKDRVDVGVCPAASKNLLHYSASSRI